MKTSLKKSLPLIGTLLSLSLSALAADPWPELQVENKPGTRWWWLGSAVDSANLKWNLDALHSVGIGSVEVTPIYGVKGREADEIDYLSPRWMEHLGYVQQVADSLGMLVDMNGGTGWPFGGPNIDTAHAASRQLTRVYHLKPEAVKVKGRLRYTEQRLELFAEDPKQAAARPQALLWVPIQGERQRLDISTLDGRWLNFAPQVEGDLYVLFAGKTYQKVKRAAPGGVGLVMNHLSKEALDSYLERFDQAFGKGPARWPHSFFNDSYEVYGADWSENLLDEFRQRRGYDLADYLPEWRGEGHPDTIAALVCDYRRTLAEMLLDNFTRPWTQWAHSHGASTRNQAHGSPGNLLDLYAAMDIPECESFGCTAFSLPYLRVDSGIRRNDAVPATLRYASSAAHVSGKPYTSSESMTWLTEHFRTSLALIKPEMDLLFVNGVNRVFYHGSPYTPQDAPWPGWLFYASIQVNPNNTIFRDMEALNLYIARVQHFLQQGSPDNELLLYFPIYDIWENYRKSNYLSFEIHKLEDKLPGFERCVDNIVAMGYDLDYISDDQLLASHAQGKRIYTEGHSYQAVLVPSCRVMPLETFEQLLSLAQDGADVLFLDGLPERVPGLYAKADRQARLEALKQTLSSESTGEMAYGKGCLRVASSLETLLSGLGLKQEPAASRHGLSLTRRRVEDGWVYFLSLLKDAPVEAWVPLAVPAREVVAYNPVSGQVGLAPLRYQGDTAEVFLSMRAGESIILKAYETEGTDAALLPHYPVYKEKADAAIALDGPWTFRFTEGAPMVEGEFRMDNGPVSWTTLPDTMASIYAGRGAYTCRFRLPKTKASEWVLAFEDGLWESARVKVNGQDAGCVWAVPYRLAIGPWLKKGKNTLEIEVSNLPANRIADMDRRGVEWRIFKDINLVSVFYKPIDFGQWTVTSSGLTKAPRLLPME